jgi:F-type H+-transporting ATPase subunit delta
MSENQKNDSIFDDESMHVGPIYAKALLAAIGSSGSVDAIMEQFHSLIHDVFDKQPVLELALANPKLPSDEKIRVLDKAFHGKMDATLLTFLKVVSRRGRLNAIRGIYRAAASLRDEAVGRVRVLVTTAQSLDANALGSLKEKLENLFKKEVAITTKVDATILGGLIVRVGDMVFDGSVDGQLNLLKKATLAKAEIAIREKLSSLAS